MNIKDSKVCVVSAVVLLLGCLAAAQEQTHQGALRGVVRDSLGVIPAAEVALVNEDTNAQRMAVTNEVGEYVFASVPPGPYTVRVSLVGFRDEQHQGLVIGRQQTAVLDFTLQEGASVLTSESS